MKIAFSEEVVRDEGKHKDKGASYPVCSRKQMEAFFLVKITV
jgi:hypothetical protein